MSLWRMGQFFRLFRREDRTQRWHHATRGNERYSIELAETRIRFTRDTGTRESFGGNDMPYPRFLRSQKWQAHVREIFGERVLEALLAAARERVG
jgi:hypothetical protein